MRDRCSSQSRDRKGAVAGYVTAIPRGNTNCYTHHNSVLTLRISHNASRVKVTVEGDGPRHTDERPFSFSLSDQDAEDIRWYLEDYRIYPVDPTPKIARRIERRMSDIGRELFQ